MTLKDREDHFIEGWKKDHGVLPYEIEQALRCGFSAGATELHHAALCIVTAYDERVRTQQARMLEALGVHPKEMFMRSEGQS